MLAKAKIVERRTGTFARKLATLDCKLRPVELRAANARCDDRAINRNDLDLPVFVIGMATRKYRLTGRSQQSFHIEMILAARSSRHVRQLRQALQPWLGELCASEHEY